jgi:hypothetical protein
VVMDGLAELRVCGCTHRLFKSTVVLISNSSVAVRRFANWNDQPV